MNNSEMNLQKEQQERLTVQTGEVQFLTKEEVEKRIKNRYKTFSKEDNSNESF